MADTEQICKLCTMHKIVYINFMNICKIHVNFTKTTFYLTKWLCTMHNSEAVLKELRNSDVKRILVSSADMHYEL
jgi:hypothetical protein